MSSPGESLTYRLGLGLYAATAVAAAAVAGLAARGTSADVLAVGAVATWLGTMVLVTAGLSRFGTPRSLHRRRLYTAGRSWLPTLGGLALLAAGVAVAVRAVPVAVPLLVGGALVAILGWLIRVMARNAEARGRLAEHDAMEWRARPAVQRRYAWYAVGGGLMALALAAVALSRQPGWLGTLGGGIGIAARGTTRIQYWLVPGSLVYGNPQVRHVLPAAAVTGVRREEGSIRIERRGWRPAWTMATDDLEDPDAVATALERALLDG